MTARKQWKEIESQRIGYTWDKDGWVRPEMISVVLECPNGHRERVTGTPGALKSNAIDLVCDRCPPVDGHPQQWPTPWKPVEV